MAFLDNALALKDTREPGEDCGVPFGKFRLGVDVQLLALGHLPVVSGFKTYRAMSDEWYDSMSGNVQIGHVV